MFELVAYSLVSGYWRYRVRLGSAYLSIEIAHIILGEGGFGREEVRPEACEGEPHDRSIESKLTICIVA